MMYLKMMSGDNVPDGDNRKEFSLIECSSIQFERKDGKAFAHANAPSGPITFELEGNCYVLNSTGKSIEAFGFSSYPAL